MWIKVGAHFPHWERPRCLRRHSGVFLLCRRMSTGSAPYGAGFRPSVATPRLHMHRDGYLNPSSMTHCLAGFSRGSSIFLALSRCPHLSLWPFVLRVGGLGTKIFQGLQVDNSRGPFPTWGMAKALKALWQSFCYGAASPGWVSTYGVGFRPRSGHPDATCIETGI